MLKTTVTKLRKAYSTISFAQRAFGLETNAKFYRLIASLLKSTDKRTNPDKREEEKCERGEVLAKLMLAPSETAAIFSKGLSKPEALQKSSFLTPLVVNNTREKSTFSKKDDTKQNDLNKPECDLSEVAESISESVPHSKPTKQPDAQVKKAAKSDTATCRDEIGFCDTKSIEPPNSLQNAIPDIILDKNNVDDYPDRKTTPEVVNDLRQENYHGNTFKNLQNDIEPDSVNYEHKSPYLQSRSYAGDNHSQSIKFFASFDKTRKPPSTGTNSTLDGLAKQCLDSPNNKIDERLLKEMKKLGVPQTGSGSDNSVIEENIIPMDVLRKPRKPTKKTEIDVETRKFEHPPLNYSDEQRLEFEPASDVEKDNLQSVFRLEPNTRRPPDKPLLNPLDKRSIKFDDDTHDVKDEKICYHNKTYVTVQSERSNEQLKSYVNSQNCSEKTDKPPHIQTQLKKNSENKADKENLSHEPENIPSGLSNYYVSENDVNNASFKYINKSNAVEFKPKSEQNSTKQSESIADRVTINSTPTEKSNTVDNQHLFKQSETNAVNLTMNSTPVEKPSTVDFQSEGELNLSKQTEIIADRATINSTPTEKSSTVENQHWAKQSETNAVNLTMNSTPLEKSSTVDLQSEGDLNLSKQTESIADRATINSTPTEKSNTVENQHWAKQSKTNAVNLTMNSTPLEKSSTVDLQSEGDLNLSKQTESIADRATINSTPTEKSNTVENQNLAKQSETNAVNLTMNCAPLEKPSTVHLQPEGQLNLSKQLEQNADKVTVNYTAVKQDVVDFGIEDKPHVLRKLSEDKESSPLINTNGLKFKAEDKAQTAVSEEPKNHSLERIFYDHVPKVPEPLLVFNPPEERSANLSVGTKQIEFPKANEDHGSDHQVTIVQNLKSLQIRCNVLPTKNTSEKATISLLIEIDAIKQPRAVYMKHETCREDSSNGGNQSITLKKMDHIARDKITMVLPAQDDKTIKAKANNLPKEAEIPLSQMLKLVRSRNRLEYCHQLAKNLEPQLDIDVETVTGKCGDKPRKCPPPCPPSRTPRCPPPQIPQCPKPACPRPCIPAAPPCCMPPCPNPCCPGSTERKGVNPCCPGLPKPKGGSPCSGGSKRKSPCGGSKSSTKRNPCKFSTHLPALMMDSFVSLIHQHVSTAETELAQNQFFMVTKDAYQRFLNNICVAELYSSGLSPMLNMCRFGSLDNYENMNSKLARDYAPWVPIPCWPLPKKVAKRPYPCPKGCPIPLPGKLRPPCPPFPCQGFPKRKNSFSIIDLYASWYNPKDKQ